MMNPRFLCAAALATMAATGQATAVEPNQGAPVVVVYHLRAGSTDQEGCFSPPIGNGTCSCAVRGPFEMRGTFTVAANGPSTGFQTYVIPTAHFHVAALDRTFDGGGIVQTSNVAPPSGRVDLNMTFDDSGQVLQWSSGASGVQASPILVATLTSAPACSNMVLTLRATSILSDWNADGTARVDDIFAFVSAWFAGDGDSDEDGQTTPNDVFTFFDAWLAGV